jgi:NADPH:quinone reductase-like Zn-dependent oxidoreductase
MSMVRLTSTGGDLADDLSLEDSSDLTPGAGEVLVLLEAAPINNADILFAAGWFAIQPKTPSPMGAEGVGHVLDVGPATDRSLVGRRVIVLPTLPTFTQGTWADRTVVPARSVIPVAYGVDALQLAMLSVNPATARSLLHDYVDLKPGDWIGLTLANSAVGEYVIALAKRMGVKVLAVVRREEAATKVRMLGADAVVLAGEGLGDRTLEALAGNRLRMLLDGIGGEEPVGELVRSLESGGSVVAFSAVTGQSPILPLGDLIYRGISLRSFSILDWIEKTPRPELESIYAELTSLIEAGVINAEVESSYRIDQYAEAVKHAERSERSGKVLFVFDQKMP